MKIAVLGAGISGLGSAYLLSKKHEVDLYEKDNRLGGHARTTMVKEDKEFFGVDTGFLVFNHETYPLLTKLFEELHVDIEKSDMSFAFWDEKKDIAYNAQTLGGMFFQKKNLFNLRHYIMIKDVLKFNKQANFDIDNNTDILDLPLGEYLKNYSQVFKDRYIMPMGESIWSTPTDKMQEFPTRVFLQFFKNHGLLGISTQHQWLTVSGGSINYVEKISQKISGKIIKNSDVVKVIRKEEGVKLVHVDGSSSDYDKVILAMHAPEALKILDDPSDEELQILSCFAYKKNDAYLHNDTKALYPDKNIYAAWNYKSNKASEGITLTYWINRLQNLKTDKEYFVSLNESSNLDEVIEQVSFSHPQFDKVAIDAQNRRVEISGKNDTYFAGAYWRYGFHEDGLWSANCIAKEFGCEL